MGVKLLTCIGRSPVFVTVNLIRSLPGLIVISSSLTTSAPGISSSLTMSSSASFEGKREDEGRGRKVP